MATQGFILNSLAIAVNDILALNNARYEITQDAKGQRGDPFLQCRDENGKKNWRKFVALCGDSPIDMLKLNEDARELDETIAEFKKALRQIYREITMRDDTLGLIVTEVCTGAINLDCVLADDDDTQLLKIQKAKNGKGRGVVVANL